MRHAAERTSRIQKLDESTAFSRFVNRENRPASYENCGFESCRKAWNIVSNEQMTYDFYEDSSQ